MQSNSKLQKAEKAWIKAVARNLPKSQAFGVEGNTTVFVKLVGPHTARVSSSVASPDERKLRRTVGMYHAERAMHEGRFMVVPRYSGLSAQEIAHDLAITLGC